MLRGTYAAGAANARPAKHEVISAVNIVTISAEAFQVQIVLCDSDERFSQELCFDPFTI